MLTYCVYHSLTTHSLSRPLITHYITLQFNARFAPTPPKREHQWRCLERHELSNTRASRSGISYISLHSGCEQTQCEQTVSLQTVCVYTHTVILQTHSEFTNKQTVSLQTYSEFTNTQRVYKHTASLQTDSEFTNKQ